MTSMFVATAVDIYISTSHLYKHWRNETHQAQCTACDTEPPHGVPAVQHALLWTNVSNGNQHTRHKGRTRLDD